MRKANSLSIEIDAYQFFFATKIKPAMGQRRKGSYFFTGNLGALKDIKVFGRRGYTHELTSFSEGQYLLVSQSESA